MTVFSCSFLIGLLMRVFLLCVVTLNSCSNNSVPIMSKRIKRKKTIHTRCTCILKNIKKIYVLIVIIKENAILLFFFAQS